jgi:hypothetical protein
MIALFAANRSAVQQRVLAEPLECHDVKEDNHFSRKKNAKTPQPVHVLNSVKQTDI